MANNSSALPRVTFQTPEKPGEESSHRKLGKLTIKYNRKDLQRWLDLEEWINAQLQELYQYPLREKTDAEVPGPVIDLEDLLEVPNEEQKLKLQEILHECSSPTEEFPSWLGSNKHSSQKHIKTSFFPSTARKTRNWLSLLHHHGKLVSVKLHPVSSLAGTQLRSFACYCYICLYSIAHTL
ncbi:protein phosphatase 1 regulatory subunit 14D isoform X1 [Lagopus muta]|uniref:protein phosphatase 1 regulatory subunit 14D isoform X1 n=1 Tax=Lagopus muta TaxID=64668 RepID=UPI00209D9C79|nr:protein phosphatase 1 regulatory subunit 14D isoform X1 [Lagopus muta]XP_048803203.1 protein phosphatase 1 regulatory subunit 14D isoform X1 [Lagopus muta]XP_048803204.1 protein phosphatase 1 regulatory subunit 14D isoform X1 [Lagopus muta]XP_048803205.1 protein phosphatase 1 regulatory subunit 14D isoform X1 [Lagopus muta]XP_048803206.1 protein phosphatase 1 regulatory subunit 14D isoform X1 [Lagopus muta]XP_048803207.1 protein phosphatase 1 regulatory subunit 14D isoform X1 [Lagopus muta]